MSTELLGALGIIAIIVALMLKFWLGAAFLIIGFLGYGLLDGWNKALLMIPMQSFSTMTRYDTTVIPMFILMAAVSASTGISGDLYRTARVWFGQIRGGLAMATVAGCGMFAAISGSSMATSMAIGKAAYPELRKYGYDERLAAGSIAAGGTIGNLIPPSMGFILYGILTETSVGNLFMAGILPGLLEVVLYMLVIYLICRLKPEMGPPGPKTSIIEKIVSLKDTWHMIALFLLVMGGIYLGIFTPTEAGAIGAFGALIITFFTRRLTLGRLISSLKEAAETTGMLIMILVGVMIFMRFLTVSGLPAFLGNYVTTLHVQPMLIMLVIIIFYLFAGAFMDILACIFITVPIFFPIVMELGFDPLWFGVIVVMMFEIGAITPPMGLNVFVLSAATDVPVMTIFRGIVPFLIADLARVILVVAFPAISLYLPMVMRG
ncbi:MAG TPA: TRAP transporter large permease [Firmicutes bacterium]|nr:TRAP transporter large permease [Bacillota bacterium]